MPDVCIVCFECAFVSLITLIKLIKFKLQLQMSSYHIQTVTSKESTNT